MKDKDEPQNWYFIFGSGHAHPDGYVKIHATFNDAREEMFRRYDAKWSTQHTESDMETRIKEWGMHEVD